MIANTRETLVSAVKRAARRTLAEDIGHITRRLERLERDRDLDRSQSELGSSMYHELNEAREAPSYARAFDEPQPLVSIVVATYNRSELVAERAVQSLLNQTYENIEILVVGDACTDDTEARVLGFGDSRVRWTNLPVRGAYPDDSVRRWMVAGTAPTNAGLRMARGAFVTHLDDDDEHHPTRIKDLVDLAQATRAEVLWHPFRFQDQDLNWHVNDAPTFTPGKVSTSSIFYHSWFARIEWDMDSHLRLEPGDWARLRKFAWIDARMSRHPAALLDHYRERSNR